MNLTLKPAAVYAEKYTSDINKAKELIKREAYFVVEHKLKERIEEITKRPESNDYHCHANLYPIDVQLPFGYPDAWQECMTEVRELVKPLGYTTKIIDPHIGSKYLRVSWA